MKSADEAAALRQLADLTQFQYGLLTTTQVRSVLTQGQGQRWGRRGILEPMSRGVWRLAGATGSWHQRVMAACLAIGPPVAASHQTAAQLFGLEGIAPDPAIHIVVPRHRSGRISESRIVVHHARLWDGELTALHDIPVTSVPRTLLDLSGVLPPGALEAAADDAIRRRLASIERLTRSVRGGRRRVNGVGALDRIVDARDESGVGDSVWEDRIRGWIVAGGLPPPVRRHHVDLGTRVSVLDLAYPAPKVGIEFDGWIWHGQRGRFDHDRMRTTELTLAGWIIVQVTSAHAQEAVVGWVRQALVSRQAACISNPVR